MYKRPKFYRTLKILAIAFFAIAITLVVIGCTVARIDGLIPNFALLAPGIILIAVSAVLAMIGFSPDLNKLAINMRRTAQMENKDTIQDIANTNAEIATKPITDTVKAVKNGLKDTKYCKHCGAEIDSDSTFCKYCGKQQ